MIVKDDHPTEWMSHLQPVLKPNNKIRECLNPQNHNQAIKKNQH